MIHLASHLLGIVDGRVEAIVGILETPCSIVFLKRRLPSGTNMCSPVLPPWPSWDTTAYGPSWVPGARVMGGAESSQTERALEGLRRSLRGLSS